MFDTFQHCIRAAHAARNGVTHYLARLRNCISAELRQRLHVSSRHAEHWGFVAVAAVDAFHLHSFLFIVSLWLLFTGLAMEFFGGAA